MMNTKKCMYFLFKIVLFIVNYHECYFVFIEFEYYMKLFVWMMKTMPPPPSPILGGPGTNIILDLRGGDSIRNFPRGGQFNFFCIYLIIACEGPCPNIALKIALLERFKSLLVL